MNIKFPIFEMADNIDYPRDAPKYEFCGELRQWRTEVMPTITHEESLKFRANFNEYLVKNPNSKRVHANQFYSSFYAPAVFINGCDELILSDSFFGIIANAYAGLGKKIHYFGCKKTVRLHRNVKNYKGLPLNSDLRDLPCVLLYRFLFKNHNPEASANAMLFHAEYTIRTLRKLRAPKYYVYQPIYPAELVLEFVHGTLKLVPFTTASYHPEIAIEGHDCSRTQKHHVYDIFARKANFDFCMRLVDYGPQDKLIDWDSWVAREYYEKIGKKIGPLPTKKEKDMAILPTKENAKYFNSVLINDYDATYTYITAFIDDIEPSYIKVPTQNTPLKIIKKEYTIVDESGHNSLKRISDLVKKNNSQGFYIDSNDRYLINIFHNWGPVFIRGYLPNEFKPLAGKYHTYFEVAGLNEAREIAKKKKIKLIENFDQKFIWQALGDIMKPIAGVIEPIRIWIKTNAVIDLYISVLHYLYPAAIINVMGESKSEIYVVNWDIVIDYIDAYIEPGDTIYLC